MKLQSHLRTTIALALAGSLALAACGGNSSSSNKSARTRNASLTQVSAGMADQIASMAAGCGNNVVLTTTGEVVSWGAFGVAPTKNARLIASSCWNAAAITDDGEYKIWGDEDSTIAEYDQPQRIDFSTITQMVLTYSAGIALDSDGKLHQWGQQDGLPEDIALLTFKKIATNAEVVMAIDSENRLHAWTPGDTQFTTPTRLANIQIAEIAGGMLSFTILDVDGKIHSWSPGQSVENAIPSNVAEGIYTSIATSLSDAFSIAIDPSGKMVIWGSEPDTYDQQSNSNTPAEIPEWVDNMTSSDDEIVSVSIGLGSVFVLYKSGANDSWSFGSDTNADWPYRLRSRVYVSPIAAGGYHTYAIDETFAIRQLDDSSQTTVLPEGNDFIALAAGLNHGLAIRQDGTLAGWFDSSHQKSKIASQIPEGLADVTDIAAGYNWSIAVVNNSEVHQWGSIFSPQSNIVELPVGDFHFDRLKATYNHAVALVTDWGNDSRRVLAWGDNSAGQATIPESVINATDILDVAAGYNCSAALHYDGKITVWGTCSGDESLLNPPTVEGAWMIELGGDFGVVMGGGDGVTVWGANSFEIATIPDSASAGVFVAVGRFHAVTASWDGNIVAWGDNSQNQATVPEDLTFVNLEEDLGGPPMSDEEWLDYIAQVEAEAQARAAKAADVTPAVPATLPAITLQDGSTITVPTVPVAVEQPPVAAQSTATITKVSDPSVIKTGAVVTAAKVKTIIGVKGISKVVIGKVATSSAKNCAVTSKGIKAKKAGPCLVNIKYVLKKKTISAKINILVTP
ncbi:MAG: hypothetical protein RJA15_1297 [Actinomycetota bacterium]